MKEREGTTAMTVYILVCFVLAGAAAVGFKLMRDRVTELTDSYHATADLRLKIDEDLYPNIKNYYDAVSRGDLTPVSQKVKDETAQDLETIARDRVRLQITADRNANQFTRTDPKADNSNRAFTQNYVEVKLLKVRYSDIQLFLALADERIHEYAFITELQFTRVDQKYDKIALAENSDQSLWNCDLKIVWFGPSSRS